MGTVSAELNADGSVTIENVASRCHALDVAVDVPGLGRVVGDVGYGGNWFFVTHLDEPLEMSNVGELTRMTQAIQDAITAAKAGRRRSDRSHRGVGAAVAIRCGRQELRALLGRRVRSLAVRNGHVGGDGAAARAEASWRSASEWRQESITGSRFVGWLTAGANGELIPHIRGQAFVTGEATLRFDPADPFRLGIGGS